MNSADIIFCMALISIGIIFIMHYSFFYHTVKTYWEKQQSAENIKKIKNIIKSLDETTNLVKL